MPTPPGVCHHCQYMPPQSEHACALPNTKAAFVRNRHDCEDQHHLEIQEKDSHMGIYVWRFGSRISLATTSSHLSSCSSVQPSTPVYSLKLLDFRASSMSRENSLPIFFSRLPLGHGPSGHL